MNNMLDCIGEQINVGDYCFSDITEIMPERKLSLCVVIKLTEKMVKIQRYNKPKGKIYYKYPKEIIVADMKNKPEFFV